MPGSITAPPQETWVITANDKRQTYSCTPMEINSRYPAYLLPEGAVRILTLLLLDHARHRIIDYWNDVDNPGENIQSLRKTKPKFEASFHSIEGLAWEMWIRILSFVVGINAETPWKSVKGIAAQGLYWRNPNLLRSPTHPLSFSVPITAIPPKYLVEAVLRGDFRMVAYYANNNPERLLEKDSGIGFLRGQFRGSALQAALTCCDFAPNQNSQGMVEMMVEQLERLYPTDWHNKFTAQTLELYKSSLRFYIEYQNEKINALQMTKAEGIPINENALSDAISERDYYFNALISNNLELVFNAHLTAQSAYKFDFNPTIDAIINASVADRKMVLQNPDRDDTADSASCKALRRTLAQCREAFAAFAGREKCMNPNHLLGLHEQYDLVYKNTSDQQCLIRILFCQHLITTAQQTTLPAIDIQILQSGLESTVRDGQKVVRSFTASFPGVFDPTDRYVLLGQRPRCGAGSPYMLAQGSYELLKDLWEERAKKCHELCRRATAAAHNPDAAAFLHRS